MILAHRKPQKMKHIQLYLSIISLFLITSCTISPSYVLKTDPASGVTTEIVTVGASLLTKVEDEATTITKGDLTITHRRLKKDETRIANTIGTAVVAGKYIDGEVSKVAAKEATSRVGIKTTGAVETSRISNMTDAAKTLGGNPEANVGAIEAAGKLYKP